MHKAHRGLIFLFIWVCVSLYRSPRNFNPAPAALAVSSAATLLSWRKDMLLTKATQARSWGWQLFGFLQHDSWGRPAFIHRTINKYTIDGQPWAIELITAPMPSRWVSMRGRRSYF